MPILWPIVKLCLIIYWSFKEKYVLKKFSDVETDNDSYT